MSDRDFGRYNCTARNNIGMRFQEFILAQAGKRVSRVISSTNPLDCDMFLISQSIVCHGGVCHLGQK